MNPTPRPKTNIYINPTMATPLNINLKKTLKVAIKIREYITAVDIIYKSDYHPKLFVE